MTFMDPGMAKKLNEAKAQLDAALPSPATPIVAVGTSPTSKPRWSGTAWASKKRRAKVAKSSRRRNRR